MLDIKTDRRLTVRHKSRQKGVSKGRQASRHDIWQAGMTNLTATSLELYKFVHYSTPPKAHIYKCKPTFSCRQTLCLNGCITSSSWYLSNECMRKKTIILVQRAACPLAQSIPKCRKQDDHGSNEHTLTKDVWISSSFSFSFLSTNSCPWYNCFSSASLDWTAACGWEYRQEHAVLVTSRNWISESTVVPFLCRMGQVQIGVLYIQCKVQEQLINNHRKALTDISPFLFYCNRSSQSSTNSFQS